MSRGTIAAVAGVIALVVALVVWRMAVGGRRWAPAKAVLVDRSKSTRDPCAAAEGLVAELLDDSHASSVTVMATGDEATRDEPVRFATITDSGRKRVMEGKAGVERRRRAKLGEIRQGCADLSPTRRSPVFLGLKRALEALRAHGCGPTAERGGCVLAAATDGDETAESGIRTALASNGRSVRMPVPLDNDGIVVRLCGAADVVNTAGGARQRRTARRADRIQQVWTSLFTNPGLVEFVPHCPRLDLDNSAKTLAAR